MPQQIDRFSARQDFDAPLQRIGADPLPDAQQRQRGAFAKAVEQRRDAAIGAGRQRFQPIFVVGPAIAQQRMKNRLKVGKPLIAESLGEADEGRRLNLARSATVATVPKAMSSGLSRAKPATCDKRFGRVDRRSSSRSRSAPKLRGGPPSSWVLACVIPPPSVFVSNPYL